MKSCQVAVIGDVHCCFDQEDVAYFNQSAYDLLLFTGDLANYRHREGLAIAGQMARLQKPALIIPGNHDTLTPLQLLAEIKQYRCLSRWLSLGQARRLRQWQGALGQVQVGGYSVHPLPGADGDIAVVVGRPFAMGGSILHCRPQIRRQFGIGSLAQSATRLCRLIDETPSQRLIFLAHNGPTGLGSSRDSIWGNDFRPGAGDFGDRDLHEAVDYAQRRGKQVLAVVAGHMHLALKRGGQRTWHRVQAGVHYLNAARVPRIFEMNGRIVRHHFRLTFIEKKIAVDEQFIPTGFYENKTQIAQISQK